MSPLGLRRYRAERLLRDEFESSRNVVLANVRKRLRGSGIPIDQLDLEACYAQAWQGLYTALLDGEEVSNPAGWLTVVTFRRAVDEHRAKDAMSWAFDLDTPSSRGVVSREPEVAQTLDDRRQLRELIEGLRARLSEREREAAALCYLQGLTRAEAAQQMGVAERTLQRLMEGRGRGRPGVAGKLAALAKTISEGRFCDEQTSLMRAYAFGALRAGGERHRLARAHVEQCTACRAYVRSLRGLASVLPPTLLPGPLAAALAGHKGARAPVNRSRPRITRRGAADHRGSPVNHGSVRALVRSRPGGWARAARKARGFAAKAGALRVPMQAGAGVLRTIGVKTAAIGVLSVGVAATGAVIVVHAARAPQARGHLRARRSISPASSTSLTVSGAPARVSGSSRAGGPARGAEARPRAHARRSRAQRRSRREGAAKRRAARSTVKRPPLAPLEVKPQEFAIERSAPSASPGAPSASPGATPATRAVLREFGGE